MALSPSIRRYYRRFFGAMAVYLVSLIGAKLLVRHELAEGPLLWPLALLPGLAIIGAIWAIALRVIEMEDEYLRMLMVRQLLVATGIALAFCSVWGFLENFALVPHLELFWVVIIWMVSLPLGGMFNRIRDGAWGEGL